MKNYKEKKIPDSRGAQRKYPLDTLKNKGDFFIWDNKDERRNIYSCAKFIGISVSCRLVNNKLHVIRTR